MEANNIAKLKLNLNEQVLTLYRSVITQKRIIFTIVLQIFRKLKRLSIVSEYVILQFSI